jgi:3-dehydroshikimate dehydratase
MLRLAAFADEISPDLDEQIRVCRDNDVTHFELRSVNLKNVLDFDGDLCAEIRAKLADNGMGVVSIGSPIGKVKIADPWEPHFDRFKIAVELAEYFDAPFIRLFSYYPPEEGGDVGHYRDKVLERFRAKVAYLKGRSVTMIHENEKGVFGEKGPECVDLMKSINSPCLRSAFDFANFVQVGDSPAKNWPGLKPYTVHIHINDALASTRSVVPAGKGDGNIGPIVADAYKSGYRGFLSLEPHLKVDGHSHGETGPELFKVAADALKSLCARVNVPLAGA